MRRVGFSFEREGFQEPGKMLDRSQRNTLSRTEVLNRKTEQKP